jgi:protein-tyrosine phosphatase
VSSSVIHEALHKALTHPLIMAAKRPLKDAWWIARGQGVSNPPLPRSVKSMLFLCKGNICRSPFAALRARQVFADRGLIGVACDSAGIDTTQAARPPLDARRAARDFSVSLDSHSPVQMTPELVARYDLTVVMEVEQLLTVRRRYPDLANRVFLLPLLCDGRTGYARYNIADPFGQPAAAFERCYRHLDEALVSLANAIVRSNRTRATTSAAARGGR